MPIGYRSLYRLEELLELVDVEDVVNLAIWSDTEYGDWYRLSVFMISCSACYDQIFSLR